MKLESLSIRDFRGIEELDLSFKDEIDLIRDVVPIVGPNTSGKTSILDAIALCSMPVTDLNPPRAGLRMNPSALVRSGAVQASVAATFWFSDDEIEANRDILTRVQPDLQPTGPIDNRVTVHWTYPDPKGQSDDGSFNFEPADGVFLFAGRRLLLRYLHVPGLGPRSFRRIGGVFLIDQERTNLLRPLSSREVSQVGHLLDPGPVGQANGSAALDRGVAQRAEPAPFVRTSDPRLILTSLAMRAKVAQEPGATEKEDFEQLKQLYEHVCRPHTIGELFNTEHGLDIAFHGDRGRYYFDGLSSGQQMILMMLLQFATRRIHHSIVLIDELELHLHPLWQDRLYVALPRLGEDNQYFFTTHSMHLRNTIGERFYHPTGNLAEPVFVR